MTRRRWFHLYTDISKIGRSSVFQPTIPTFQHSKTEYDDIDNTYGVQPQPGSLSPDSLIILLKSALNKSNGIAIGTR